MNMLMKFKNGFYLYLILFLTLLLNIRAESLNNSGNNKVHGSGNNKVENKNVMEKLSSNVRCIINYQSGKDSFKYLFNEKQNSSVYKLIDTEKETKDIFSQDAYTYEIKVYKNLGNRKFNKNNSNWTVQNVGPTAGLITVSIVDENIAWVIGYYGEVFRTTNGGTNWIRATNLPGDAINIFGLNATTAFACVNFENEGQIYSTTNGGNNWNLVFRYLGNYASIVNVYFFNDSDGVSLGNPVNGVLRVFSTSNSGLTWDTLSRIENSGEILRDAVVWFENKKGWFGTTSSYVYYTTNGGLSWFWSLSNDYGLEVYSLAFINDKDGLTSTTFRFAYNTTDGGNSWSYVSIIPAPHPFTLSSFICGIGVPTARWWATSLDEIYISTDHGSTWTLETFIWGHPFNDISMKYIKNKNILVGYAVTAGNFIAKYSEVIEQDNIVQIEMSKRWNMISVPMIVNDYRIDALYPTAVSKAYTYSGNYLSKDTLVIGVGYWLKFPENEIITIFGSPLLNDTIDVVEGWNMIGSISKPVPVSNIQSIPSGIFTSYFYGYKDRYIICDTIFPGKGYWVKVHQPAQLILTTSITEKSDRIKIVPTQEMPPSPPESENLQVQIPDRFVLEQNYPNPFNQSTKILYGIPEVSFVTIKLFNMLGQEIKTIILGVKEAGWHEVELDTRELASGIYLCRLQSGAFVDTKKILLMK